MCNFEPIIINQTLLGGIDDTLNEIIEEAKSQSVPLVFSMTRRRLARILKKKFNIGCVGILSCAGAEVSEIR